jgi:hypothetical protein
MQVLEIQLRVGYIKHTLIFKRQSLSVTNCMRIVKARRPPTEVERMQPRNIEGAIAIAAHLTVKK